MLELNFRSGSWSWGAWGKHPCARDYLEIGNTGPLFSSLAKWVEDGYKRIAEDGQIRCFRSWRFWLQTGRDEDLAVGVIRESSDSIGRHFPLMIMGSGSFPGWQSRWELLPFDCEDTWGQMEMLASRSLPNLAAFSEELGRLRPPVRRADERQTLLPGAISAGFSSGETSGLLLVGVDGPAAELSAVCTKLRNADPTPLKGYIAGGGLEQTSLLWLRRALNLADFELIWRGN